MNASWQINNLSSISSFHLFTTTHSNVNATTSSLPQDEQSLIDAFNTYVQIGIGSLLFLFGLTFNCLSLLYFCVSRSFRHTTFRLYFSIISVLDTLRLLEFLVFLLFDKGYLKMTLTLCRSVFFAIMFTGQASIWLTVALAVEKCIIIWFPIKGRLCFTISISKVVLIFVLLLVFFADVIYLLPSFFLRTYENPSIHTFMCVWQTGNETTTSNIFDQWKKHYFTFNTIFFHSIIPSILLLIINWLILYSLSRQRISLASIGTIDARHVIKREKQFKEKTIQLVLSSFFVIITISPRYILTMVNIFASNISKKQLMPLHIYVNLNTVFRVLEMSNYSLNMIFAIMSGRTSRREIRKLLWEGIFWRFKRAKAHHRASRLASHSLFDDDDEEDTDRSVATTAYYTSSMQGQGRLICSSRSNSNVDSTLHHSRSPSSSLFTCCGFTIDMSHKQSHTSSPKSPQTSSTRRSTLSKVHINNQNHFSPSKTRRDTQLPTSSSSYNRQLQQKHSTSYPSNGSSSCRATVVHCFQQHSPRLPISSNRKLAMSVVVESDIRPKSQKQRHSSIEILPPVTSSSSSTVCNSHFSLTNDPNPTSTLLQTKQLPNEFEEKLPAYIVEKC